MPAKIMKKDFFIITFCITLLFNFGIHKYVVKNENKIGFFSLENVIITQLNTVQDYLTISNIVNVAYNFEIYSNK